MKQRGATLIEVLVAAGLLLLILNFVFPPLQQSLRSSNQARLRLQALTVARDVLHQVKTSSEAVAEKFSGEQTVSWGQGNTRFSYEVVLVPDGENLTKAFATVFWGDKRLTLSTVLLAKESDP